MDGDSAAIAKLASLVQLVFAALLGTVASVGFEPGFVPRGLVLFITFGLPAAVGALGVRRRRPGLLFAAGAVSFVGAFIAFSGFTLIFLFPAVLFVYGAVQVQVSGPRATGASRSSAILHAAAALAVIAMLLGAGGSVLLLTDDRCWAVYPAPEPHVAFLPFTTHEVEVPAGAEGATCSTGVISARGVGLAVSLWAGALLLADRSSRRRAAPRVEGAAPT